MSKRKQKGLSRIDSGSTHGWFVRAYKNGKTYSRLFSDKKCGSKKKAYERACEHLERLKSELEKIPSKSRQRRMVTKDSRNKTGVLGVSRTQKKGPNGSVHDSYSVTWRPEKGVQKCTSFSIKKYGEKKAFELAVRLRKEKMKEIYGRGYAQKVKKKKI